ncbi:MAG: hypothetical protein ACRDCC_03205, partial [Culicoidibacterales bacterium]
MKKNKFLNSALAASVVATSFPVQASEVPVEQEQEAILQQELELPVVETLEETTVPSVEGPQAESVGEVPEVETETEQPQVETEGSSESASAGVEYKSVGMIELDLYFDTPISDETA